MKFEKIIQSAKNVPKTVGISNLAILAKKAKNSFQNLTLVPLTAKTQCGHFWPP